MRISWLSADEIAAAREALTAGGATWDDHFDPEFKVPPNADPSIIDWDHLTEHVARAERVVTVLREHGLDAARARFGSSRAAIEVATLAAAALEDEQLSFDQVIDVLRCSIDSYVFYAPFLELMVDLGRDDMERTIEAYEEFAAAYARALSTEPHGQERIGAVADGLADFYVRAGRIDQAQALFERRHDEDQGDVAVALSASRAFLAAGSVSHAVRWLGVGAARATALGRDELANKLRLKQERVRERLS
jgi:tetratricopeptide (TPR) repeat protein